MRTRKAAPAAEALVAAPLNGAGVLVEPGAPEPEAAGAVVVPLATGYL